MFEDSLIESSGRIQTKSKWTAVATFFAQVIFVIGLILMPLIYTEALPTDKLMSTFLVAPPPPPPPPPPPAPAQVVKVQKVQTEIMDGRLMQPTKIPQKIKQVVEDEAPAPAAAFGVVGGVAGGVPGGSMGGVIGGIIGSTAPPPVVKKEEPKGPLRVSGGVIAGQRIDSTRPAYPPLAKSARVQGTVKLAATISKSGAIENLRVLSGHPMLVQAALDAARNFRYRPYILNGEPVEVETTIDVNFTLSGG